MSLWHTTLHENGARRAGACPGLADGRRGDSALQPVPLLFSWGRRISAVVFPSQWRIDQLPRCFAEFTLSEANGLRENSANGLSMTAAARGAPRTKPASF
jgi:hypothetical protein